MASVSRNPAACLAFATLLLIPATLSEGPVHPEPERAEAFTAPTEWEADDVCAESSGGGQAECAVNALQRHAGKALASAPRERVTPAPAPSSEHPIIRVEMFRAMAETEADGLFLNVDTASLSGVLNYLHTEVVAEHTQDYDGLLPKIGTETRFNNISVIAGITAHVRNPEDLLADRSTMIDFALSAHFVDGRATGVTYNWDFGDVVGAQKGDDKRYPTHEPFYKFSLSGFCPNLKFSDKRTGSINAINAFAASQDDQHGRRRRAPAGPLCMTYSKRGTLPYGEVLRGGLCVNGTQPGKRPTGGPGCVYTYEPPNKATDIVSLDNLVGITKEKCGKRECKDWRDFRHHCSDRKLRRKFNYVSRRRGKTYVKTRYCVEYDIHKACARDCNSPHCLKVPPHKREIGIDFWKGRCNAQLNEFRAERLGEAFGIKSATYEHQLLRSVDHEPCVAESCQPNATIGGPYCTRSWGGVCQPCRIPNTTEPFPDAEGTPLCPWGILRSERAAVAPACASDLPRDLCCLYSDTCNSTLTSDPLPVDEDGYAYASSRTNTGVMVGFLQLATYKMYNTNVTDLHKLEKFAYWQWGLSPAEGSSFAHSMKRLKERLL